MAWLSAPDDRATEELLRLTEPWRARGEQVPPVMAVLKPSPRAFAAVLELNYAVAFGASKLGRRKEELIAVWVSALNDCFFCLATHARYLESVWNAPPEGLPALLAGLNELAACIRETSVHTPVDSSLIQALPGLESDESELLRFVAELSVAPEGSSHSDCARLGAAGYSEDQIIDVVLVASCFAFMNRLACGTGVTLDPSKFGAAERYFGRAALDRHIAWGEGAARGTERAR